MLELWKQWGFVRVCVDASGIGAGLASFLERARPERVERFVFTQPSKSHLAFDMLAMINTGRLSIYNDATAEAAQFWREATACRYRLRSGETIS